MLILFLSGILIFVILLPVNKDNGSYKNKKSTDVSLSGGSADLGIADTKLENAALDKYKKGLEKELEDFLMNVEGVGDVKVLIYMKSSQEFIVEKNNPTSSSTSGDSSDLKKEESTVYTTNANGDEVPFISQTKGPAIDGVVIAAKGASNEAVKLQIVRLVMALYGVEANKIEVLPMQSENVS